MRTDGGDLRTAVLATASSALRRRWTAELSGRLALVEAVDRVELEAVMLTSQRVVVFLDLTLPGLNGLDGVPDLHQVNPGARIVLLASAPSEREAVFALATGARGYCDRDIAPALVSKAAEVVQKGEIWIGRRVVQHLLRRITSLTPTCPDAGSARRQSVRRFAFLGPRERQIALLVGTGANNKKIAADLGITESTVKGHLTSIFRKLDVPDRLRLALFVTGNARARRKR
jgi:DNA-binding NarL/FixJ family response regulator